MSAALKLFVEFGFHGTPTSRIAVEAGVSNGTLFHYFKTKDELVQALYIQIKQDINAHLAAHIEKAETYREKMKALFTVSIQWALKNSEAYYFVQQFHFSPHMGMVPAEEARKQAKPHTQLLHDAFRANIFKPLPVELIGSLAASQINGMYMYLTANPVSKAKQNKLIEESFEFTWAVLANNPRKK